MKTSLQFRPNTIRLTLCVSFFIVGLIFSQQLFSQAWPVNLEGAPALQPGQIETSLYFSGSYMSGSGKTNTIGYIPGVRIGFGIARIFDLKLSYSRGFYTLLSSKWEDTRQNNLMISPKLSFVHGILAIKVPVTVILYKISGNQIHADYLLSPRFIITAHYKQFFEFSFSPFCDILFQTKINAAEYYQTAQTWYFLGANLGFGFSSNMKRWSIRPEAYFSYPFPKPGERSNSMIFGWGLSASVNFDAFKKKEKAK